MRETAEREDFIVSTKNTIAIHIAITDGEKKLEFNGTNAWIRNDGTSTIYASRYSGITKEGNNVISIPAGCSAPVFGANGIVYLLGSGVIQLISNDFSSNPFNTSTGSRGSTVDSEARTSISAHVDNADIHVTAAEKAAWNGKAELSDIPYASELMKNLCTWTSGNIRELALAADSGCVFIYSDVTGMPRENTYWFGLVNASTAHRSLSVFQIDGQYAGYCSHNSATDLWSDWKSFADDGDAATLQSHSAADFVMRTEFETLSERVNMLANMSTDK